MRVRAFAKINLSLRVLGRRPDGYHELRTIFQSIALHDTLTIRAAPGPLVLTCDDPACPSGRRNLVWRAAERTWRAAGRSGPPRGVAIHLTKRIPMEAGLGGGSSDAAAAIQALGRLWGVDGARRRAIAAALGADVPYFLEGGTVLGLERGDLLYPLRDQPAAWVVVAVPRPGVSAKDAFSWFEPRAGRRSASIGPRNDLQQAVVRRHPGIGRLVRALARSGATLAAMSGSGSAVFGLFPTRAGAVRAAARLSARLSDGRAAPEVFVTRTVDRRAYQRLAAK